jgi:asparagine synthase (glutamine-hydrolysing)
MSVFLPPDRRKRAAELLADPSYLGLTLGMRRVFQDAELTQLGLDAERLGLSPHWLPPEAYAPLQDSGRDLFRAVSQSDIVFFMGNMLLRDSDINSMANSVEVRVPFLSRKLIDFVGGIPGQIQFPPGQASKHLLRKAIASKVPSQIMNRPKKGFLLPLCDWIAGPLKHDCKERVQGIWDRQVLCPDAARQMWSRLCSLGGQAAERRQMAMVTLGSYLEKRCAGSA